MCFYQSNTRSFKTIGTDQDKAIYNGFLAQTSELNLSSCAFYLEKGDRKKLFQLNLLKGAIKRILADIYRSHYRAIREYGLTDSKDNEDFAVRLESMRQT